MRDSRVVLALALLIGIQGTPGALAAGDAVRLVNRLAGAPSPYLCQAATSPVACALSGFAWPARTS